MHRAFILIASITMLLAFGCKGCQDSPPPLPAAQSIEHATQGDEAKLSARLNSRKLDRSKVYPKDAEGVVACGNDIDCFVVQAESCTKADLDNTLRAGGFGIEQAISAQYHLLGGDSDHCNMTRHITEISVGLNPKLEEALRKQGKTDDEIAKLKADSQASLRKRNPPMLSCTFDAGETLAVALDIAEAKLDWRPWRNSCKELPSADAPAATPADNAAPAKPTENP